MILLKKIIDGKRYNTATAVFIGESSYGSPSDFKYVCEELNRTPKGVYFLHACGGAGSSYGVDCGGNTWDSGEYIIPMTVAEAQEWAEKNLKGDVVDREFADTIEDA